MDECKNRDPRPLDLDGVGKMTQREKFEEWFKKEYPYLYARTLPDAPNDTEAQLKEIAMWKAWQESAKQPEEAIARLRMDAERYRWLRDPCADIRPIIKFQRGDYGWGLHTHATLDKIIDAELNKETP